MMFHFIDTLDTDLSNLDHTHTIKKNTGSAKKYKLWRIYYVFKIVWNNS